MILRATSLRRFRAAGAMTLAALLFLPATVRADWTRIKTGRGDFLVEVVDPAVKARAEGDDLVLSRAGGDDIRLKLPADLGNSLAKEAILTIERDGKMVASVRRVGLLPAPAFAGGEGRTVLRAAPQSGCWSLAITDDGRTLVSGHGGFLRVWDLPAGTMRLSLPTGRMVRRVDVTPDGSTIASAEYLQGPKTIGNVVVRDGKTGVVKHEAKAMETGVNAVTISPDGKVVVSTCWGQGELRVWDAETGEQVGALKGHNGAAPMAVFSPDGKALASGGFDATIRLWDADSGATLKTLRGHEKSVEAVAFSPDGKALASGGFDDTARVWDASSGQLVATFEHDAPVLAVAFSPDGKSLATASARWGRGNYDPAPAEVQVWDLAEKKPAIRLPAQPNQVFAMVYTPDGKTLITASLSGAITLWELEKFRAPATPAATR